MLFRICELLTTPTRHYKNSVGKFLRALERSIDVVTEVTERGDRITGNFIVVKLVPMFIVILDAFQELLPDGYRRAKTDHHSSLKRTL